MPAFARLTPSISSLSTFTANVHHLRRKTSRANRSPISRFARRNASRPRDHVSTWSWNSSCFLRVQVQGWTRLNDSQTTNKRTRCRDRFRLDPGLLIRWSMVNSYCDELGKPCSLVGQFRPVQKLRILWRASKKKKSTYFDYYNI